MTEWCKELFFRGSGPSGAEAKSGVSGPLVLTGELMQGSSYLYRNLLNKRRVLVRGNPRRRRW